MRDPINPDHYRHGGIEVIDAIEAWELNYQLGTVVKYVARAGKKHKETYVQDLKKARWFLEREIARMDEQDENTGKDSEGRRDAGRPCFYSPGNRF